MSLPLISVIVLTKDSSQTLGRCLTQLMDVRQVSLIPIGPPRPNIPEYPQIAEHIRQAIYEVEHEIKTPVQAINDAAFKSAKVLGG